LRDLLGDWAADSLDDSQAGDAADRCDFGRGAAEEDFVGDVEGLARDERLDDLVAVVAGDAADTVAGNPGKDRGTEGRGEDAAVADEEDVFAGAFADVAVNVERDAFGVIVRRRFL